MGLDASFLAMLNARPVLARFTGEDQWGNDQWDAGGPINAFVGEMSASTGGEDGQGQQDGRVVYTVDLITDALSIGVKDRLVLQTGQTVYVTSAVTNHDGNGTPLFQNVTATTASRG